MSEEIGLMSLMDNLIVLENGKRYSIGKYIELLQKENKQLQERLEKERNINEILYRADLQQQVDLYKRVIDEVRELILEDFNKNNYLSCGRVARILSVLDKTKGE